MPNVIQCYKEKEGTSVWSGPLEAAAVSAKTIDQEQEDYKNDDPPNPAPRPVIVPAPSVAAAGIAGIAWIAVIVAAIVVVVVIPAGIVTFIVAAATGRYLFIHKRKPPFFDTNLRIKP